MDKNEVIQWSIVGLIVLAALVWALIRIVNIGKGKSDSGDCNCCGSASDCKAKELKDEIRKRRDCRDGRSARN